MPKANKASDYQLVLRLFCIQAISPFAPHCKGDALPVVEYVKKYIPNCESYLSKIKPTQWDTLKTEAIDFDSDFFWLDDYPMIAEKQILRQKGKESNLIVVDLNRHNELNNITQTMINVKT